MPNPLNTTNIPSNRVEFIDPRTGMVSREWYRFFLNLFNLAGAGSNQISLDELQIGPPPMESTGSGGGGGTGTVTSVGMSVPTGLSVIGSPITTSGTFAVSYAAGYAIPTTAKQTEWDTAYTDRFKWDGGATDLVAATGRTSLGATTVGGNFFTLPDPSAITFVQINADNTITAMDAPTFRTAIGAGTGVGSVTSVDTAGTVNGLTLTGGPITTSGTITLGGTLDLSSPPAIGGTTPNTARFTTLTATGQTSLGGVAGSDVFRVLKDNTFAGTTVASFTAPQFSFIPPQSGFGAAVIGLGLNPRINSLGTDGVYFLTNQSVGFSGTLQAKITHTTSAVNYVQVTGAATGSAPTISAQGSDTNSTLAIASKGTGAIRFDTGGATAQFRVLNTASAVNRIDVTGSATGFGVVTTVSGADTNISQVFQSKGTGAIDLAAGSSGVNISNGGTVTAITRTAGGTGYATAPTVAISAPTTAGGVQATATVAVSAGAITTFTITNAGSGYVEQPTVSFSGGGGSGAAAYATVGSSSSIKQLGGSLGFSGSSGEVFRVYDFGGQAGVGVRGHTLTGSPPAIFPTPSNGSQTNISLQVASLGTGAIQFSTNAGLSGSGAFNQIDQMRVSHTASAVNYVQVTGAATGGRTKLSSTGSDATVGMVLDTKGSGTVVVTTNGSGVTSFEIAPTNSPANYLRAASTATTVGPILSAQGTDTNIDLTLTPKGTGVVRTSGTGIRLYGSTSGYVGLKGAAVAGSTTYTLPAADGTSGQVLSTDGASTLSWATPSGGSSNITAQGMWENALTISSNYTITSGNSAMSAGPITIASGVVVTVPSGSRWVVV